MSLIPDSSTPSTSTSNLIVNEFGSIPDQVTTDMLCDADYITVWDLSMAKALRVPSLRQRFFVLSRSTY